jgi:hypothetical protein
MASIERDRVRHVAIIIKCTQKAAGVGGSTQDLCVTFAAQ